MIHYLKILGILAAIALTFTSTTDACTTACVDAHNYRIFGLKFETFGFAFFSVTLLCQIFSPNYKILSKITAALLGSALGAEIWFIYIQQYKIGHLCPICLSIFFTLLFVTALFVIPYFIQLFQLKTKGESIMKHRSLIKKAAAYSASLVLGFIIAFSGTVNAAAPANSALSVRNEIAFGNRNSHIEIYLFTDWACPSCKKLEPVLAEILPAINNQAKFTFVDFPIHKETLNFVPYNLSFMVYNKDKYLQLRDMLTDISNRTMEPDDKLVQKEASRFNVNYNELHFSKINEGNQFFKEIAEKYDINATPTLVIVNTRTSKNKTLAGTTEITKENILQAIKQLH